MFCNKANMNLAEAEAMTILVVKSKEEKTRKILKNTLSELNYNIVGDNLSDVIFFLYYLGEIK